MRSFYNFVVTPVGERYNNTKKVEGVEGDFKEYVSNTNPSISIFIEDDIEVGWGRKTWGNLAWGDAYAVLPAGQQITSAIGTAIGSGGVIVTLTGQAITSAIGSTTINANARFDVTGQAITAAIGTVEVLENESMEMIINIIGRLLEFLD